MRVLSVIFTSTYGGPHNQALRLAPKLAEHGWQTVVALADEPGNSLERLRAGGVEVHPMPLHRLRASLDPRLQGAFLAGFAADVVRLRRLIRDQAFDLVQVHGILNPQGALAARAERKPILWQILGVMAPMPLRRVLMPFVVRYADALMTTGREVARLHPGALSLDERLVPFYPPVDAGVFRPDPARRAAARRELGVPPDTLLVGTVGNLNKTKAQEYFVRAAALVRERAPEAHYRILGAHTPAHAGYYERVVRAEAARLGLLAGNRLDFVDPGERVAELMPAFDIFVLTSRIEGVPTTVMEAMATGLPVVTTDVGAVREIVEDGITGFVVPPHDPAAVAVAVLRLAHDAALRKALGDAGRERVLARYSIDACAAAHLEAYHKALAHRGGGGATRCPP